MIFLNIFGENTSMWNSYDANFEASGGEGDDTIKITDNMRELLVNGQDYGIKQAL